MCPLALLKSPSFWVLIVLCLVALVVILTGSGLAVWGAGVFVLCLFIASVIGMLSFPTGREVAFAAFLVSFALSIALWLRHGAVPAV